MKDKFISSQRKEKVFVFVFYYEWKIFLSQGKKNAWAKIESSILKICYHLILWIPDMCFQTHK